MSLSVENELKASAGMAPVRAGTIWNAPEAGDSAPERSRSPDGPRASEARPGGNPGVAEFDDRGPRFRGDGSLRPPDFAPASRALHPGYKLPEATSYRELLGAIDALGCAGGTGPPRGPP